MGGSALPPLPPHVGGTAVPPLPPCLFRKLPILENDWEIGL